MVEVPAKLVALSDKGKPFEVDKPFVIKKFGKQYYNELTKGVQKGGFCTVPVGDYKELTLHQSYPELCCAITPKITYQQSEGMDMCAFKSFASVVHALGWRDEAKELNCRGHDFGKGSSQAFDYLKTVAMDLLPKWLQVKRMPRHFSHLDITPQMVAVVVLRALDGNCSHAVTIHGGYVYDTNEEIAIPLGSASLDYCCCNGTIKAKIC